MIRREQLEVLERFDGGGANVLSAYLDVEPERRRRGAYTIVFRDLVRDIRRRLDKDARRDLAAESARIEEWLQTARPDGRGVAVFSCLPRDLWQVHVLPDPVRDVVEYDAAPHLAPLLDVIDEYERYAVAVVDKEKARLLTVYMGEIEESDAFKDFVPGKHDQGGPAQARYQRHHETHVLWHLKHVVATLEDMLSRRAFDRLILGGPEEATSELSELLPEHLAQRLVSVIPVDSAASAAQILELTLEVERGVERDAEMRLVNELLDLAGGGGRAACGPGATIDALVLGEVSTLVLADGLRASGSECPNCGHLEWGTAGTCPVCGHALRPGEDIVDRLVQRAAGQSGEVEIVHDEAAQRLTDSCRGVGGVLRFRAV
jgi:peptide chain release factor subunit 1